MELVGKLFNRLRAYRRAKVFREVVRGVMRLYACEVVCFCVCLFVVCLFSVFACSFLFCLVGCLCVRVLFACLYVSLLMLAKAFQNACQNARKIAQKWIKINGKTGKIYKNGGLGVPEAIFGSFGAPGRH